MENVTDAGQSGVKAQKRERSDTFQACLKRRKKLKTDETYEQKSTFDDREDLTLSSHKKQLFELAEKDPEFYKFLKEQESDLLNFDESDSDIEKDPHHEEADSEVERSEGDENVRRDSTGRKIIDVHFITNLQNAILEKDQLEPAIIRRMVAAFTACVARVGADIEPPSSVINDSDVFESVVRLCFTYLGRSLLTLAGHVKTETNDKKRDLELKKVGNHNKNQYRRWKKHGSLIKSYLHALLQFLNEIQTSSIILCTLRAIGDLLELYIHFPNLTRNLIKAVIKIWGRRTDECRIAAFLILSKLVRIYKTCFPVLIKRCYLEYVMNVRDVKAESWPLIVLMQKSFAELCMTYPEIAYQYAFVYIRQTAIHLRNAMIAKRKDLIRTIYNWQFMQCLYLWSQVVAKAHHYTSSKKEDAVGIRELIYPLCQIAISTMKLFPSLKYFPLRLHCLRILFIIQQNCHTYVPTLSLAVELLFDALLILKKKPMKGKEIQKNVDMRCTLKVSAAHIDDPVFRQAAFEELFRIHLEAAHIVQRSSAFSDIIIPINHQIKAFVKNCRSAEFSKLFKSLEAKLQEQAAYAREILNSSDIDLTNEALMKNLERRLQASDAPLTKFYDSWQKMWKLKNALNPVDTKPVQQLACLNLKQNATTVVKTRSTLVAKANKVKKTTVKRIKRKSEGNVLICKADEDVLEDLMLSDIED